MRDTRNILNVDMTEMPMLYLSDMKPITTKEACNLLGIHKNTLYRWGETGKIKMKRDPIMKYRKFDYDEIKRLAEKLPKRWERGTSKIEKALSKKG